MKAAVLELLGLNEVKSPFRRLWPYVQRYKWLYALLSFCLLFGVAYTLFFAWFLKTFADRITESGIGIGSLASLFAIGAAMTALKIAVDFAEVTTEFRATDRIVRDVKNDVFRHMLRLPASYYLNRHSGDHVSRLTNDVYKMHGAVGRSLINLIKQPLAAAAACVYLTVLSWKLALICFLVMPVVIGLGGYYGRKMRANGREIQGKLGAINGFLNDVFAGHLVVRAFQLERPMEGRSRADNDELYALEARDARLQSVLQAGTGAVNQIAFLACLGVGAMLIGGQGQGSGGGLTIGTLLAFIALFQSVIQPISGLARQWGAFQTALSAVDRVCEVLETPAQVTAAASSDDSPHVYRKAPGLKSGIALSGVVFGYDEDRPPLFDGLSLRIPAGKVTALVGPSGAGKSTLFHLLLGFHKPQSGTIAFDGVPIEAMDVSERAAYTAVVLQEPYLFTGTVRDNIALGRPGAPETDIRRAAREANADSFILSLPDGYDTQIGERGVRLSGGQKQRIAIARAILRDAPILLLDEATSSLDSRAERAVQEALDRLTAGRTTIVIAHRLSTVRHADHIIVLDGGAIVEQGHHELLMERRGLYRQMHAQQLGMERRVSV
ncbi:MAG TPA: ABC transporter ATP-binding protein [Paenibacillus sp.]|uniref:ABC transporter ATP-binding protein n=1 Tax=Paenibacillus sp. TaxID=58172 RepID=UPI002CBC1EE9|nr:ABC transporter ATP-binding protein [Paenibacillus sp.]HUC92438.1 ABC transporter ATP-binding protein [Paenibacillus sp.]